MQRSSSLEVFPSSVSSWWDSTWKKPTEADVATDVGRGKRDAKPLAQEGGDRVASPRRHGAQQRSTSLEKTASSLWGSVWKGTRNLARGVTQTATETARILADEARTVADEVRELVGNQETGAAGVPNGQQPKSVAVTQYIEWFIDFEADKGSPGLELEPHVKGEPWRVLGVTKGLPVDAWNAETVPVTIYLYPGRREKVMRRMIVRPGDELFAVDGEPVMPDHDLEVEGNSAQRVRKCQALTLRRKIPPPAQRASTDGTIPHLSLGSA